MTRPLLLLALFVVACSSSPPGPVSACSWPADLDPSDASAGRCTAKRHRFDCEGTGGVHELCLSNLPDRCEGSNPIPDTTFTCHDQCGPQEYGVVCGRVGPSNVSSEPPSPSCRAPGSTPAGVAFYCCPCGS
ncbi:MAG TPA: hypothetical protein VN914_01330 [Polyangia bacterium]|nr:hypothetical protein [Polyangia bacterium]